MSKDFVHMSCDPEGSKDSLLLLFILSEAVETAYCLLEHTLRVIKYANTTVTNIVAATTTRHRTDCAKDLLANMAVDCPRI